MRQVRRRSLAPRIDGSFRRGIRSLTRIRPRTRDFAWFYHPEMQARIERAMASLREGRGTIAHSVEELLAQLHALRRRRLARRLTKSRLGDGFRRGFRRLRRIRPLTRDSAWFDHPEMQARIAEAEADRREARVTICSSVEELMAHLHGLNRESE